jgi:hypothetical protein
MNLNELNQEVIDLRKELNDQFNKYIELVNETYELDFSEIWTDRVREDRAELFEESMREEIDELCRKHNAFVEDSKHVAFEAKDFLHIATDNLTYEDDLTLEELVKYEITTNYPDSILIEHIYKDDDALESLIDELDAEGMLDNSRIEFELEQVKELLDTVKKTVIQLTTVKEEIAEINSSMTEFFSEFCESYEELKYRHV